ncbi:la protein homolog [Macrobrachium rosenbergii]|uniref:la protein homolog n=1 Tax=Macrobrachium rosenbergii TaxID=79674 RepID=UPI0034D7AEBC
MTEGEVTANGQTAAANQSQDVDEKIIRQVEYYFGDYNLPRDKFLQEEIKKDDGWIALETMTKFKRLAALSTDSAVISGALKKSKNNIIEVHENNEKIRRVPTRPLPVFNDEVKEETVKKTVYCKGFPKDGSVTLDDLLEFFKQYGPYETVLMRYFHDRDSQKQGFKGSVYVVFPTQEKAKEFREKDEVRFKDILLIRKWQSEYLEEKKKEIEERRARKEARKNKAQDQNNEDEAEEDIELPKGTFIHFSGITAESEVSREDLKEALGDCGEQCAFVDYSRGLAEGYFRFKEEEYNTTVMEKTEGKLKVKDMDVTLRKVEGEEEEEQLRKMKEAQRNCKNRAFGNRKRKMGGGRGGFQNKRKRL